VDLGWIAFYVCWGAAALLPSMRELTEPKVLRRRHERLRRLVLLGLACLIAPAVLLIEVLTGNVHDGLVIAVLSAVLSVLVLVRLGRAVRIQRASVERERALASCRRSTAIGRPIRPECPQWSRRPFLASSAWPTAP
jgi:Flp pilus assembly protein TadB